MVEIRFVEVLVFVSTALMYEFNSVGNDVEQADCVCSSFIDVATQLGSGLTDLRQTATNLMLSSSAEDFRWFVIS